MDVCLLILEDDPVQIESLIYSVKESLPDCSFRLEKDGKSLLRSIVRQPPPNLLILDINTPVMGGFEVLASIRKRSDLNWLPIVMFSSDDSSATQLKSRTMGANGFKAKPLLSKMGKVLVEIVNEFAYRNTPPPIQGDILIESLPPGVAKQSIDSLLDDL